jgi:tRNA (guanine10-N2)-methyltransferase
MQSDILDFSYSIIIDEGRLCMWMPTSNDEEDNTELAIPQHPGLELKELCVQDFNKWSRRLLTYRRIPEEQVVQDAVVAWRTNAEKVKNGSGVTADELNNFRRKYFQGFKDCGPFSAAPACPQESLQ